MVNIMENHQVLRSVELCQQEFGPQYFKNPCSENVVPTISPFLVGISYFVQYIHEGDHCTKHKLSTPLVESKNISNLRVVIPVIMLPLAKHG